MEVLIKLSDAIKTLKSMAVPLVRKLPSAQPEWLTDYSFEESCTDCPAYDTENHRCPRFNQVIRTVLKDANLEPCENCISRQAAIDAIGKTSDELYENIKKGATFPQRQWFDGMAQAQSILENLPSAQPEKRTEKRTETHSCDLISRQEAIEALAKFVPYAICDASTESYTNGLTDAYNLICQLPSAQPERKIGRWIYGENDGQDGWYCSECRCFVPWDYDYYGLDNIDFIKDFKTCPRCDARMISYTGM